MGGKQHFKHVPNNIREEYLSNRRCILLYSSAGLNTLNSRNYSLCALVTEILKIRLSVFIILLHDILEDVSLNIWHAFPFAPSFFEVSARPDGIARRDGSLRVRPDGFL